MQSRLRSSCLSMAMGLLLVFATPNAAAAGALYLNNYGSGWGLWLRGHYVLKETENDYVLEVERISVEPNRAYPQSFDISGFKLTYYFRDKDSGEALDRDVVAGPPAHFPAKLRPTEALIVEGVTMAVAKTTQPNANESLILELHVITTSGASIGVAVGEFFSD
ncbi:hypothetical protein [Pelagibius sp. Alg239-R121]|uniref:hypothetical protein n=1 Tax=Pelagibius sp. Alg239-R121 TaxID=2993448 RepID=UPI0024A715D3|nr:hypothetical protein [Pelagibius sp. Alg239-R121]